MSDKKFKSKIGGQAVLEGVMMRGTNASATAVRDSSGNIQIESERFTPLKEKSVFFRIPIIRGVCAFVANMVIGFKTLTRSSEVFGDFEDGKTSSLIGFLGIILGVALAVGLFVFLPNLIADQFFKLVNIDGVKNEIGKNILRNLTSGIIRIVIFVLYLFLISLMKDIKRLFRYHGAEHKTISCFEHGLEMNVANAQKMSTLHDRCGTTFIFLVMVVSIIAFSFTGWQVLWLRVLIRLAGIPVVAGVSYEILMVLAKRDNIFVKILKAPGMLLQKISTAEPDDAMVEVALVAFNEVMLLQENPEHPTKKFVTAKDKASFAPPQYKNGAPFYGLELKADYRALVPRFDTEILAEQVILRAKELSTKYEVRSTNLGLIQNSEFRIQNEGNINNNSTPMPYALCPMPSPLRILDLCTGSGAIAIAIKKNVPDAEVFATDISEDALSLAKENALAQNTDISFIKSDMFKEVEGQYDIIVSNPPYIPTKDIETLDNMVKYHEPRIALDGGEDGLKFYREIALNYKNKLNKNGTLFLEIGIGQADRVKELFGENICFIKDYNNPPIERVAIING
ncbi:MAG: peptide chain release factor N(5)-glutamine methyltransferase [Firmicutes bacterium]|nr:peptide chain release factor N(5)-glutamine methyltransferase [Bacillota bacterium]